MTMTMNGAAKQRMLAGARVVQAVAVPEHRVAVVAQPEPTHRTVVAQAMANRAIPEALTPQVKNPQILVAALMEEQEAQETVIPNAT